MDKVVNACIGKQIELNLAKCYLVWEDFGTFTRVNFIHSDCSSVDG